MRRGDYVWLSHIHPVQPLAYYQRAVELMGDYQRMLVFSDDLPWCRENFSFNNMTFVEGQSDMDDLWMMGLCKHNIIANSSFSWWGAWLNENHAKKVVAPKLWFGNAATMDTKDIVPAKWILL